VFSFLSILAAFFSTDGNIFFKREGITLLRVPRTKEIQRKAVQLHTINEVVDFPFRALIARLLYRTRRQ
jgi:hypothetical protein